MEHITEILAKQQELEALKEQYKYGQTHSSKQYSSKFCKHIFSVLHKAQKKQKRNKKIKLGTNLFIISAFLIPLAIILISYIFSPETYKDPGEITTLFTLAEKEIAHGNYDKARLYLEESFKENPDNYAGTITYFDLYNAEKNYDQAAWTLIRYINEIYGIQNVMDDTQPYQKLKEFSKPLSEDMQKKYDACIRECEKSAGLFHALETMIDTENFRDALALCDSLKSQKVNDNILIRYYCSCYIGLKEYEACARYLIDYGVSLQNKPDDINQHLDLASISYYVKKIYSEVSEETQKELEDYL